MKVSADKPPKEMIEKYYVAVLTAIGSTLTDSGTLDSVTEAEIEQASDWVMAEVLHHVHRWDDMEINPDDFHDMMAVKILCSGRVLARQHRGARWEYATWQEQCRVAAKATRWAADKVNKWATNA